MLQYESVTPSILKKGYKNVTIDVVLKLWFNEIPKLQKTAGAYFSTKNVLKMPFGDTLSDQLIGWNWHVGLKLLDTKTSFGLIYCFSVMTLEFVKKFLIYSKKKWHTTNRPVLIECPIAFCMLRCTFSQSRGILIKFSNTTFNERGDCMQMVIWRRITEDFFNTPYCSLDDDLLYFKSHSISSDYKWTDTYKLNSVAAVLMY